MAVSPEELDQRLAAKRKQSHKTEEKPQARALAPRGKAKEETPSPSSPEIEKVALSCILSDPEKGFSLFESTANDRFFTFPAQEWYRLMRSFYRDKGLLDAVVFIQFVLDNPAVFKPIGGHVWFATELQAYPQHADLLPVYIEQLREKFLQRAVQKFGFAIASEATSLARNPGQDSSKMMASIGRWYEDLQRLCGGVNGAINFDLDELLAFDAMHDPNCLVGRRFLVRGGSWMIAGPTGCGKSSLLMQLAIYWATGNPMFGVRPVRPLKSLIFQAEDDFGDVSEQLQGVFTGIQASEDLELEKFNEQIRKNLVIKQARGISGDAFLSMLEEYARLLKPDLVGINPLFAYAGCDISDPSIGGFLRDKLFALGDKYRYCTVVMHHISKPPRDGTEAANTMYLGFGSSEVQNSFRATSTIVPCKSSPGTWRFDFGKRTDRAGAKTPDGEFTDIVYMEHAQKGICWHQVEEPEGETGKADDILREMSFSDPIKAGVLQKKMSDEFGMAKRTFFRLWGNLKKSGNIKEIKGESGKGWVVITATGASGANAIF